jgi:hypothetical protein
MDNVRIECRFRSNSVCVRVCVCYMLIYISHGRGICHPTHLQAYKKQ